MLNQLEIFMPWFLTFLYGLMVVLYIFSGKWGPVIYWVGALILNVGVLIMARTSG